LTIKFPPQTNSGIILQLSLVEKTLSDFRIVTTTKPGYDFISGPAFKGVVV
jgi:hypothetical protein